MPFHISSTRISRRRFVSALAAAVSGGAGLAALRANPSTGTGEGSIKADVETWALVSDTHIAGDSALIARGVNMADHLRQAVLEILDAHAARPLEGLMINGDCAFLDGRAEDYKTLGLLIKPVAQAGVPIHLTLGNHDERGEIQTGLASVFAPSGKEARKARVQERAKLENKLASKVSARYCDWYFLDSLETTNSTPGSIGEEQMAWLDQSLKASPDRPALVMVHHNPQTAGAPKISGLKDTASLSSVLARHRQVKALFFGHTHVASVQEVDGLHWVNLPACAYHFSATQPTGWTMAKIDHSGCTLTLFDTARAHPLHAQEIRLEWRTT